MIDRRVARSRTHQQHLAGLARRLGVPVERLVRVLQDLGEPGLARGERSVPEHLLPSIRQKLGIPITQADRAVVDDLMRGMGVQRLDGSRRAGGPGPSATPAAMDADVAAALQRAQRRADQAEARLGEARARQDELVREIERLKEAVAQREAALEELRSELQASSDRLQQLQEELERREALLAGAGTAWSEVIERVGLSGRSEEIEAVAGLAATRRWPEISVLLRTPDPDLLQRRIETGLLLVCNRPECVALPDTVATVQVPPGRCRVCGGGDPREAMKALVDALLLRGRRRVMLLGGQAPHRHVLSALGDPRVQVEMGPLEPRRLAERCERLAAQGYVVVCWSREGRPPVRDGLYHGREVVGVAGASLAEALVSASRALERIGEDPAES